MRVTGPLLADDAKALVAAACAGMGLVLLPEWLTGAALDEGRLVRVLSGWTPEPATTPLYAVHASGPYVAPKIRSFLDFLVERFARG